MDSKLPEKSGESERNIITAVRLEPRSLIAGLVTEVSCEDNDAVVRVSNEDSSGLVELHVTNSGDKISKGRKGASCSGEILEPLHGSTTPGSEVLIIKY